MTWIWAWGNIRLTTGETVLAEDDRKLLSSLLSGDALGDQSNDRSTYLITGGTGSLGTALTLHLLSLGHKVRVLARNEHGHERLRSRIAPDQIGRLSSFLGSVTDPDRISRAADGCDYVVHAAAQKIIPLAEYNPIECAGTNIGGTAHIVRACLASRPRRCVFVSTDKASAPATLYGASKLVAERLWLNANRYAAGREPVFVACRYGNVWGSQGSVINAFQEQAQYGYLQITDPECTRFHITLAQAVAFVLHALGGAAPGELWIPRIPSYRLGDLADACGKAFGLKKAPAITGLRLAEKLHESMISPDEWPSVKELDDYKYILEPGAIHRKDHKEYNSGMNPWKLSPGELEREVREWASL